MTDGPIKADVALRAKAQPASVGVSTSDIIAGALSLIWLLGVALFLWTLPSGDAQSANSFRLVLTVLAIFLPIAMIWIGALALRSARIVRIESQRIQAAIDGMRQTYVADRQAKGASIEPSVARKLDEIARATQKNELALASFASTRPAANAQLGAGQGAAPTSRTEQPAGAIQPPMSEEQPRLALGTTAEDLAPPLSKPDLVRALNFPDDETDEIGFAALRRALKDRKAKQLIQASQDVLTLLSQDGIYMDDLQPDRARAEIWRRFAGGERGKPVAALGGIRDRSSLAITAARMREDTIFRDTAHHFLRKYDQMLVEFEAECSDADIAALAETRTSRAFMLIGRVMGAFD